MLSSSRAATAFLLMSCKLAARVSGVAVSGCRLSGGFLYPRGAPFGHGTHTPPSVSSHCWVAVSAAVWLRWWARLLV